MRIKKNPDEAYVEEVMAKLKDNDGYCPCKLQKTPETKCMCKEFRDAKSGMCHCGLYIKEEESSER